jgi:hypothetical protein
MTEYLIAARAAVILWTNLAVMPAEILFDAIEAELERLASSCEGFSPKPFIVRAVWNGIAIRTKL